MTLFEECIQALGNDISIHTDQETKALFDQLVEKYPFTKWGRINWQLVDRKHSVQDAKIIENVIEKHIGKKTNQTVIILWNYSDSPAVSAPLRSVIENIDDVMAVGSDTWILSEEFIVEFFHEGEITVGFK